MSKSNRFFIINDIDRPYARHIVERFSDQKATYIHPELINWNENNGFFQITDECTDVEDFGLSIDIHRDKVTFRQTGPSTATYRDGKPRHWQGESSFSLPLYGILKIPKINSTTTILWTSPDLPDWSIENHGNNVYNVISNGIIYDTFTHYSKNRDKVIEEWFTEKIISNLIKDTE